MKIGHKIRELRRQKDLTQDELGRKTKIHGRYISKLENNHSVPSIDIIKKIASALDITVDHLLYDKSDNLTKININDKQLLQKFEIIDKMDESKRRVVNEILDGVILKEQFKSMTS